MTTLLKQAFGRLMSLPARDQDLFARQLIEEVESEKRWNELFESTTDEQWEKMVSEAKKDIAENGTMTLDELKAHL